MLRRIIAGVCGVILALSAAVGLLAGLLDLCGTQQPLMEQLMLETAPPQTTGLPESDYAGITQMITRYLAGTGIDFQYTYTDAAGQTVSAFQEHERQHMADCLQLFILCRSVLLCAALTFTAALLLCVLLREKRSAAIGCLAGSAAALLCAAALGLWAAVDFNGPFLLFHRIAFTNQLWLLDPRTDLLIRLMPIGFFIRYVTGIAVLWLLGLLSVSGVSLAAVRRARKDRG